MQRDEIENRFTYHPPQPGQPEKYEALRRKALEFAEMINELVPESREQSLAITQLEMCVMFANAGIARNKESETQKPGLMRVLIAGTYCLRKIARLEAVEYAPNSTPMRKVPELFPGEQTLWLHDGTCEIVKNGGENVG